jgi:hypothetical protein
MPVVFTGAGSFEMKEMKIMKRMKEMSCAKRGNITPEAYPVNNAGIYPGEKK